MFYINKVFIIIIITIIIINSLIYLIRIVLLQRNKITIYKLGKCMNLGCLIGIGVKKECFSSYLTELKLSKFIIFGPFIKHITKFKFFNLARKVYLMLLKKKLPTGTCSGKFILTKNSARNLHHQNPIINNY